MKSQRRSSSLLYVVFLNLLSTILPRILLKVFLILLIVVHSAVVAGYSYYFYFSGLNARMDGLL